MKEFGDLSTNYGICADIVLRSQIFLLRGFFTIRLNNLIVSVFHFEILRLHEENLSFS